MQCWGSCVILHSLYLPVQAAFALSALRFVIDPFSSRIAVRSSMPLILDALISIGRYLDVDTCPRKHSTQALYSVLCIERCCQQQQVHSSIAQWMSCVSRNRILHVQPGTTCICVQRKALCFRLGFRPPATQMGTDKRRFPDCVRCVVSRPLVCSRVFIAGGSRLPEGIEHMRNRERWNDALSEFFISRFGWLV
mmetsp:Transcript_8489/g.53045  ORF Transcript_8489/g.53045 Transcript_8489/m.53045 type:complete len:194 (-) Transcript_8489:226-807(-)